MADERTARPVSGEIMAAGAAATEATWAVPAGEDVVDAEFETLRPDPAVRLAGSVTTPPIGMAAASVQGLDTLRKDGGAARTRGGPIFWIVGLGLAAGAFWVSGGHALVRQTALPAPAAVARPANPLRIADVVSRVEERGGRTVLFIDGKVVNQGAGDLPLPALDIAVTANGGALIHYKLGTSNEPLTPGGTFSFSSRLEAPKEGVKSVAVTFRE